MAEFEEQVFGALREEHGELVSHIFVKILIFDTLRIKFYLLAVTLTLTLTRFESDLKHQGELADTDIADHVLIYFMKARRVGSAIEYAQVLVQG